MSDNIDNNYFRENGDNRDHIENSDNRKNSDNSHNGDKKIRWQDWCYFAFVYYSSNFNIKLNCNRKTVLFLEFYYIFKELSINDCTVKPMGFSDPLLSILPLGKYDNDLSLYPLWCLETSWNSITIRSKSYIFSWRTVIVHSSSTSIWVMQGWQPPPAKQGVWE